MRKMYSAVIILLGICLLAAVGFASYIYIKKYMPTNERADLPKLLGTEDGRAALFLNEELQEEKGYYSNGQIYLPLSWVNEKLNERFYWDRHEEMLVYALPDTIVYAGLDTVGSTGAPLAVKDGEEIYLAPGLVLNYTDIRIAVFDQGQDKRMFINSLWTPEQKAGVLKKGAVRVKGGVKSPVITEVQGGETVKVIEKLDRWAKVLTQDGYVGYLENRRLGETAAETPVSSFEAPVYKNISIGENISLVWHQVTSQEGNGTLGDMIAQTKGVDVISPTWFELSDNEGNYRSLASREYVEEAHGLGLQVWALINNFSNEVNTEELMSRTSVRKKLIDKLIADAETYRLDGINLDFEGISSKAGPHYVQFIRELSIPCRQKGIVLSVDNTVPTATNLFYNRREQGIVADYVIIMGYDEHYSGGEAGSVASLEFVKKGIENTLKDVPGEKIITGVPFYTRIWTDGENGTESKAVGIAAAKQWIEDNDVELYWQQDLGQYYGELAGEEGVQRIWMEEERSLGLKMDLIREYRLAGVACWKLGFEPPSVWDVIDQ